MKSRDFPEILNKFQSVSNDMLETMLDQSEDCIKVIGTNGTVDYMNRNGQCAMGIDNFALIAGKHWWDLCPEEAQPLIREAFAKAQGGDYSRCKAFVSSDKGSARVECAGNSAGR